MPKSITTPSNTQNATTNAPALFKVGDAVLFPSIGSGTYKLHPNGGDKNSTRLVIRNGNHSHGFYRDGRISPNDALPSIFHDTPANRQAIATLLGAGKPAPLVIDTTDDNDDEVIILSSHHLSNIACDTQGAINVIGDLGRLLALIYYEKIDSDTAISMARLAYEAAGTWEDILRTQLEMINEPLAMTGYGKEGE